MFDQEGVYSCAVNTVKETIGISSYSSKQLPLKTFGEYEFKELLKEIFFLYHFHLNTNQTSGNITLNF